MDTDNQSLSGDHTNNDESQLNTNNDESQRTPLTTENNNNNNNLATTIIPMDSHDADDKEEGEESTMCPICFRHDNTLAMASCQHVFCIPCLERILLGNNGHNGGRTNYTTTGGVEEFISPEYPAGRQEELDQLKIPAWNVCPVCRQSLFLWDLRHVRVVPQKNGTINDDDDDDGPQEKNTLTEDEKMVPNTETCRKDGSSRASTTSTSTTYPGEFVYSHEAPTFNDIPFLRSSVWLETTDGAPGREGYGSFHFPPHTTDPQLTQAYYNLEHVSHKRLLLTECLYHETSRILSAQLANEDEMSPDESSYRLILAFSSDGSFVRSGALVVEQPPLSPSRYAMKFPFDGLYTYQDERITVVGHKCIVNGQPLLLQRTFEVDEDYSDSLGQEDKELFPVDLIKLVTPDFRVMATTDHVSGVGVGAQLIWNMKGTHGQRTMHWLREGGPSAVSDRLPRHKIHRWGGAYARRWLRRQGPLPRENGGSNGGIPVYHANTVWGNVFCQAFKVGLASYHFVPPTADEEQMGRVYISYENPATSEWPPLDNGQPIPAKVYFHNISFPNATTFRGSILWEQDYGTPWQGMIRWEYEMIFDEEFTCIVGGTVMSYSVHTPEVPRELSRYGEALVYVNAALYREVQRRLTVELGEGGDHSSQAYSDSFRSFSLELRLRLQRQNASVRTIAMTHRILTLAYQQGDTDVCPIDYNV
jgi:hypothetical protein